MNFEELQQLWGTQPAASRHSDEAAMLRALRTDSQDFDRRIARRNLRELLAGLVLLGFLALHARPTPATAWAHWLSLALVAGVSAVFVGVHFALERQRRRAGGSIAAQLAWSLRHVRAQILLLRTVALWYLAPLAVAMVLHNYSRQGALHWVDGLVFAGLTAFCVLVYWLNRMAVARTLRPRLDQLLAAQARWREVTRTEEPAP
ncbi:MAG: hypothetical protein C0502_03970 [Opitutus sp.]|nr:hypothetical protein [Opitutus sp.]